MNREQARFERAWRRLLRTERYREYLSVLAVQEVRDPPALVKRVENHSWWAHDDFRRRHRKEALGFREWLLNRLIPAVVAAWDVFDADGYFSPQYLVVIRRIAGRRLQGEDPEALIHELWAQATRYLPSYDGGQGDFERWINTIAINLANGLVKRLANGHAAATQLADEDIEDDTKGPLEEVEERDWADVVLARIRQRDELAAEIFRLRKAEERSCPEIDRLYRHDRRLPGTFRVFFPRVPWEPNAAKDTRLARLKRLIDTILEEAQEEAERGES